MSKEFVTLTGNKGLGEDCQLTISKQDLLTMVKGMDEGLIYSLCLFCVNGEALEFSFMPVAVEVKDGQ